MNKILTMSREEAYSKNLITDCTETLLAGGVTLETIFKGTESIVTSKDLTNYILMVQESTGITADKFIQNMGTAFIAKYFKMKREGIPRLSNELYFEMVIEADLATRVIPLKAYSHYDGMTTCMTFALEHEVWN